MPTRQNDAYRTLVSSSRVTLLHLLQEEGPSTVDVLADATGLHPNTTREHLQRLVRDGFAQSAPQARTTRGRPRLVYSAVTGNETEPGPRVARRIEEALIRAELTRVLLGGYGELSSDVAADAVRAGATIASRISARQGAAARLPEGGLPGTAQQRQLDAVDDHLDQLGFDPELDADSPTFHLRRCPFSDLARERPEVVCSVHLGLVRGILGSVGGPVRASRLIPFVEPDHCILELELAPDDASAPAPATDVPALA